VDLVAEENAFPAGFEAPSQGFLVQCQSTEIAYLLHHTCLQFALAGVKRNRKSPALRKIFSFINAKKFSNIALLTYF
jgi:hypothetical protein